MYLAPNELLEIHDVYFNNYSYSERPAASAPTTRNTNQEAFGKAVPYSPGDTTKLKFDRLLTEMVCVDLQPYGVVKKEGFLRFVKAANPRYARLH